MDYVVVSHGLWRCIFSFDLVLSLVAVLNVPGGFKGGCRLIVLRFLPPWAELAEPSPVLFEKRGARAGDLSPWLDPRSPDLGVLAGKAEILGRSPPPLPFGTRVPDCSLAGELVAVFFAGKRLLVSYSELSSLKVLLLLIVSISISFLSLLTSFEAADSIVDSAFGIVVSFVCSGVVCGGGGVSSEGATRGTGFSGVNSSYVSNRVTQEFKIYFKYSISVLKSIGSRFFWPMVEEVLNIEEGSV